MSIKLPANELHGLLTDLKRTTGTDKTLPMLQTVYLHSDRIADQDVLLGASTDRFTLGMCYTATDGADLPPARVDRADVDTLLAQLDKRDAAPVELDCTADTVTLHHLHGATTVRQAAESPFPRVGRLFHKLGTPADGEQIGYNPAYLERFTAIGKRRKQEGMFRIIPGSASPTTATHILIGERYRGLIMPVRHQETDRTCPVFDTPPPDA